VCGARIWIYGSVGRAILGWRRKLYSFSEVTSIRLLLYIGIKSCGRVVEMFGLRTWTINLRTWIFGLTYLVFKTTYIDRRKPLRDGAFFFTRRTLFPPLDKMNTRDEAKGLLEHFGGVYRGAGRAMT